MPVLANMYREADKVLYTKNEKRRVFTRIDNKRNMMKKSPTEMINLMFSIVMVLLTFTGAMVFFFTNLLSDKAFGTKRIVLGVVFLAYAIYRSYRMYTAYTADK